MPPSAAQNTIDLGALNQRVTGLESALVGITSKLDTIGKSLSDSSRTQWPVLIGIGTLIFTIISGVGYITYTPVRDTIAELKGDVRALDRDSVSKREFDAFRGNSNTAVRELRQETIPRNVAEERNRAQDQAIANQQRQLDEIKKQQGEIYNARDVILDLRARQDRLEARARGGT